MKWTPADALVGTKIINTDLDNNFPVVLYRLFEATCTVVPGHHNRACGNARSRLGHGQRHRPSHR